MSDDAELVAAWRGGDRAAGQTLIERHYDAITRFFASKAGDQADDLTQRTFMLCASSIEGFRADGSFRAFLFGIARNVLYEHIRRRVRDARAEPDFHVSSLADLAPGVATLASRRAEQRVLGLALQNIPLDLQILIELYYWEELRLEELAQMLGVPEGTVKSRLHRARTLLREAMGRVPSTPEEQDSASALLARWVAGVKGAAGGRA
ncbi:MAG TPA: RNA polymerase sigma factor [Kofleriaceae bacterium]|nr:RNA polymerase sigma factor [Kofleriaceae bacterium]